MEYILPSVQFVLRAIDGSMGRVVSGVHAVGAVSISFLMRGGEAIQQLCYDHVFTVLCCGDVLPLGI